MHATDLVSTHSYARTYRIPKAQDKLNAPEQIKKQQKAALKQTHHKISNTSQSPSVSATTRKNSNKRREITWLAAAREPEQIIASTADLSLIHI